MKLKLYYLTDPEDRDRILAEGITSDERGTIVVFTDMRVANEIAKNQSFLERYAVFTIDRKGIEGRLRKDDGAEWTSGFQRIVRQEVIRPEFVTFLCELDTILDRPTPWDYEQHARLDGWTPEQTDQYFAAMRWYDQHQKDGHLSEKDLNDGLRARMAGLGPSFRRDRHPSLPLKVHRPRRKKG